MTLERRLARLEASRPIAAPASAPLELPHELHLRVMAAMEAGTFPASLSDADLHEIIELAETQRGLE